jgi:5-methylcytosine-specific restriction endonuclease McrA
MPKWINRTCANTSCSKVEYTASQSKFCRLCAEENKRADLIAADPVTIKEWGYEIIDGPSWDKFNHRVYKVLTPCGHEWEAPFTNLLKQVKNAQLKGLRPACGICGPKHRMKTALASYVEKNGIEYDLTVANEYRRKVRGITENNYKANKHIINPNNLPRGRAGTLGAHNIDHIIPIITAFKEGWPVEKAGAVENLQMLEWQDNLSKGSK